MMKFSLLLNSLMFLFGCHLQQDESARNEIIDLESPAGENSSLPHLTTGPNGQVYLSWVEKNEEEITLNYSTFSGTKWSKAREIASGNDWFVNWADYPMVSPHHNEMMMAHFLAKSSEGTYSYDIHLTMSDDGKNWKNDFVPHTDGTATEHGFVTMLPYKDQFLVAWLDGRNTGGGHHGDGSGPGAMTLRSAFINSDGEIENEVELDNRVCDCCQTGGAIADNGPVIVYRDRSEKEVRDMSIVRYIDGKWSDPAVIGQDDWQISGCPVNGPRVAAKGNSLAVAWFTAPKSQPAVKIAFSNDGGASFNPATVVDDSQPIGRVDVVMIDEQTALVSWLDKGTDEALFKVKTISKDNSPGQEQIISGMSSSRQSGFPQMEIVKNQVYWAWTELQDGTTVVRTAKMQL